MEYRLAGKLTKLGHAVVRLLDLEKQWRGSESEYGKGVHAGIVMALDAIGWYALGEEKDGTDA